MRDSTERIIKTRSIPIISQPRRDQPCTEPQILPKLHPKRKTDDNAAQLAMRQEVITHFVFTMGKTAPKIAMFNSMLIQTS